MWDRWLGPAENKVVLELPCWLAPSRWGCNPSKTTHIPLDQSTNGILSSVNQVSNTNRMFFLSRSSCYILILSYTGVHSSEQAFREHTWAAPSRNSTFSGVQRFHTSQCRWNQEPPPQKPNTTHAIHQLSRHLNLMNSAISVSNQRP